MCGAASALAGFTLALPCAAWLLADAWPSGDALISGTTGTTGAGVATSAHTDTGTCGGGAPATVWENGHAAPWLHDPNLTRNRQGRDALFEAEKSFSNRVTSATAFVSSAGRESAGGEGPA